MLTQRLGVLAVLIVSPVETTVYVDKNMGVGASRALYQNLIEQLRHAKLHTAIAGIALPNSASIGLHGSVRI